MCTQASRLNRLPQGRQRCSNFTTEMQSKGTRIRCSTRESLKPQQTSPTHQRGSLIPDISKVYPIFRQQTDQTTAQWKTTCHSAWTRTSTTCKIKETCLWRDRPSPRCRKEAVSLKLTQQRPTWWDKAPRIQAHIATRRKVHHKAKEPKARRKQKFLNQMCKSQFLRLLRDQRKTSWRHSSSGSRSRQRLENFMTVISKIYMNACNRKNC